MTELLEAALAGLTAGFGVAAPIGAITVLLVSLAARSGFAPAAAGAMGIAFVDGCYAAIATLAGAAVRPYLTPLGAALRWTASAVLIGIAVRTARGALPAARAATGRTEPDAKAPARTRSAAGTFVSFVGLTALNPFTILSFAAIVLSRQISSSPSTGAQLVFVLAVWGASAGWHLCLGAAGKALGTMLTGPRGRRATVLVSAAVIAGFAIRLMFPAG